MNKNGLSYKDAAKKTLGARLRKLGSIIGALTVKPEPTPEDEAVLAAATARSATIKAKVAEIEAAADDAEIKAILDLEDSNVGADLAAHILRPQSNKKQVVEAAGLTSGADVGGIA